MIKTSFDQRSHTKLSLKTPPPKPLDLDIKLGPQFKWHPILHNINSPDFLIKYGVGTIIEATSIYVAIGTNKGIVLIYNYHQQAEHVLIPEIDEANEGSAYIKDLSVTSLAFSQDLTHITAGLVNGVILVWEIKSSTPYYIIHPITLQQRFGKNKQGHLSVPITAIRFIGANNNQIISSDTSGLIFYHVGFKKLLTKNFISQKLLGKNDSNVEAGTERKNLIFDTQILPLGTSHQITDQLGVVAIITGTVLLILSISSLNNPNNLHLKTHYKFVKPKHTKPQFGCLEWFPCMKHQSSVVNARLAFSWDSKLWILELNNQSFPSNFVEVINDLKDKDKGVPNLPFIKECKWEAPDKIIAIKWTSSSIVMIFTESQQLITLKYTGSIILLNEDKFDLTLGTKFPDFTSYRGSINLIKNRAIILGKNQTVNVGKTTSWNDKLIELLSTGNHQQALITAYYFYTSNDYQLSLFELPEDPIARKNLLKPYLINIMDQAIPHIEFTQSILDIYFKIISLIEFKNFDTLFEAVDTNVFFNTIEEYLLSTQIIHLTPTILKSLVIYYAENTQKRDLLTEILCTIDLAPLDIDLTIQLCHEYGLNDCKIFIYNYLLHDYVTPLFEFLESPKPQVFTYLSYILTGRQYPIEKYIGFEEESNAKNDILNVLFDSTNEKIEEGLFPNLTKLLKYNSFEMLSSLNEFFEDSMLNDDGVITRQYIIDSLLDIYACTTFKNSDKCNLSIFIGRNYPKYSQFLRLSDSLLDQIIDNLINFNNAELKPDCELALQSLLSIFEPSDQQKLIEKLNFKKFNTVLSSIYRVQGKYHKYLSIYLDQDNLSSFGPVLEECFVNVKLGERINLIHIIKTNFSKLINVDLIKFVYLINKYEPSLHYESLELEDKLKFKYIKEVKYEKFVHDSRVILDYTDLLIKYDSAEVFKYVKSSLQYLNNEDLIQLQHILKENQHIKSLSIVLNHQNRFQESLDELLKFLPISESKEEIFELYIEIIEGKEFGETKFTQGDLTQTEEKEQEKEQEKEPIQREEDQEKQQEKGSEKQQVKENQGEDKFNLNEKYWLKLINTLIEQNLDNSFIYNSFKKLSDIKLNPNDPNQSSFLKIFDHFLHSDDNNTKLLNIKRILVELIVSYSYESEILHISGKILNDGILNKIRLIKFDNLKGWSITCKSCTSCGKKIYGNVSTDNYVAWEQKSLERLNLVSLDRDFSNLKLVFFKCGHGYHQQCLDSLSSRNCVVCSP